MSGAERIEFLACGLLPGRKRGLIEMCGKTCDDNAILVGEYDAIGMALQGESALMLRKLQTKMFDTNGMMSEFLQNPSDPRLG